MTSVEVDQSGKIEDLRQDTIIAFSNDKNASIRLSRKIKREIFLQYRPRIRQIVQKIFVICLYYLLEQHIEKKRAVIICTEYPGWEDFIKRGLCSLLSHRQLDNDVLHFRSIGKDSRAHHVALLTNRQVLKPSKTLRKEDVLRYLK